MKARWPGAADLKTLDGETYHSMWKFMPPKFKEELLQEVVSNSVQWFIRALVVVSHWTLGFLLLKNFASSLIGGYVAKYLCSLGTASTSGEAGERLRVGSLAYFDIGKWTGRCRERVEHCLWTVDPKKNRGEKIAGELVVELIRFKDLQAEVARLKKNMT